MTFDFYSYRCPSYRAGDFFPQCGISQKAVGICDEKTCPTWYAVQVSRRLAEKLTDSMDKVIALNGG